MIPQMKSSVVVVVFVDRQRKKNGFRDER